MEAKKKKLTEGRITPKKMGYFFPPEWAKHDATWLTWPHNKETWPDQKIKPALNAYLEFIKYLSESETVKININDERMLADARQLLEEKNIPSENIKFFIHPSNDCWCRDHGPGFLINPSRRINKVIVDWGYNAWGEKYPPFDLDDQIPAAIAGTECIPAFKPGIIMEGGSVEVNGAGTLLTTRSCLLNPNRNTGLQQEEIEKYLQQFYNVNQILWLEEGIAGDDTDGHIDDITRFVNEDTVITMMDEDQSSENHHRLRKNRDILKKTKLINDRQLNVIEIPLPEKITEEGQVLPASYANFYISNKYVLVPVFEDKNDAKALDIISSFFPDRQTVGINSKDIIWGLGSFHCLSQQEPSVKSE